MPQYFDDVNTDAFLNKVSNGSQARTKYVKLNGRSWRRQKEREQRKAAKKNRNQSREPLF